MILRRADGMQLKTSGRTLRSESKKRGAPAAGAGAGERDTDGSDSGLPSASKRAKVADPALL